MKAQFLKMAGVNSEDEFYNMFPTEESFFQAYPEARTYANGGATYPYPGQATADEFFNYGMQGRGAGAQIPVETYYAYGGFTSNPAATPVHYNGGGAGQHSSPFNYGAFPAFAKEGGTYMGSYHQGRGTQGGNIDNVIDARKDNFLAAIQKNANKAMLEEETPSALEMNQQMMPQLIAQYGAEAGSMFMPNMYNQNMFEDRYNQLNKQSANSTRNMMGLARFFTNNAINRKLQSIADQQKRDQERKMELGTDAQTTPGFNPIPDNMAKYGGSLKKYQTAGTTGASEYKSPPPPVSNLDIDKIIANTKKAGKTAAQKRKDETDLAAIQKAKTQRDILLKKYTENPEGYYESNPYFGGAGSSSSGYIRTPESLLENIKYWDDEYKRLYATYNSERGIPLESKVPGELKGTFVEKHAYSIPAAPAKPASNIPSYLTPPPGSNVQQQATAPAQQAPAPKAPAKAAPAKASAAKPKYTKESVRTIYNY